MTNDKLRAAAEQIASKLMQQALLYDAAAASQIILAELAPLFPDQPPAKRDPKVEAALFLTKSCFWATDECAAALNAIGYLVPASADDSLLPFIAISNILAAEVRRLESQGQVAAVEDAKLAEALKYIADNIAFYGSVEDVMQISIVLKALRAAQRELAELRELIAQCHTEAETEVSSEILGGNEVKLREARIKESALRGVIAGMNHIGSQAASDGNGAAS